MLEEKGHNLAKIMFRGKGKGEELFNRRGGLGHKWIRRKERRKRWKNAQNGNPGEAVGMREENSPDLLLNKHCRI